VGRLSNQTDVAIGGFLMDAESDSDFGPHRTAITALLPEVSVVVREYSEWEAGPRAVARGKQAMVKKTLAAVTPIAIITCGASHDLTAAIRVADNNAE
jgi:hypothetical protein